LFDSVNEDRAVADHICKLPVISVFSDEFRNNKGRYTSDSFEYEYRKEINNFHAKQQK